MKLPLFGGVVAGCLSAVGLTSITKLWTYTAEVPVETSLLSSDPAGVSFLSRSSRDENSEAIIGPDDDPRLSQILSYGWPEGGRIKRTFKNHVLEYDCARRTPTWVAEHLTAEFLKGTANRQASRFKMDPHIPEEFSAFNSDYRGSGWSRGHMTPAGDNKMSQESMDETFYLTNIVPQNFENNGGFWNRFEIYCRDLTQSFKDVWVTSGPLFLPTEEENGKKIVKYEVIGDSEVSVPTHLYKVIVAKNGNETVTGSFIVPNKPIDYSHHLKEFQVSMNYLERKAGVKFYTNLNRELAGDLCEQNGCNLLTKTQTDQFVFTQRLKKVPNLKKLTKLWQEIQDKEIPVNKKMQDIYQRRLLELPDEKSSPTNSTPAAQGVDVTYQERITKKPLVDVADPELASQQTARAAASG
ncbi:nuclease EXOG, mitochondrial-like [Homarus americanus]|uniref:Nuclease EXOG-like 2 n=1 Tax=Homarus americanus TaxID=6706 RepID=A0A8J5KCU4_HOMAM|nr:nuclease EXOG, mitochondrial-like [Homarus americanus]KAG7167754.1 Nuclease EXOG-like 2 [Homarus americanus]